MNKTRIRKSYSVAFKLKILEEAKKSSLSNVCREYQLDIRMVRRWSGKHCAFEHVHSERKRLEGAGRKPVIADLEDIIYSMVLHNREQSLVVRRSDIIEFAQHLAKEHTVENFKASECWLDGFMKRYELSLRRSTSLFKLEDATVIQRCVSFVRYMQSIDWSMYRNADVVCMDETAVYFGESTQTTVDFKGASSILIPSTGYESARVTCILGVRRDGTKLAPLVILKGNKEEILSKDGVLLMETNKAWSTQPVLRKWISKIMPLVSRGRNRGLIIWDSASTHRANAMKQFLSQQRIDVAMIPSGCTSYLQGLDLCINKPFKDAIRRRSIITSRRDQGEMP